MNHAVPHQCPELRGVSPATIAGVLKLIEDGSVRDGPIGVYDIQERVFLVAVVANGILIAWQLMSCPTREQAEIEKARLRAAIELTHFASTDRGSAVLDSVAATLLAEKS